MCPCLRKAICRYISLTILASLEITRLISINCSFIEVVPIFITDIVIEKEEVKESEWLEDLSFFDILIDDPKCELVLELASTTK